MYSAVDHGDYIGNEEDAAEDIAALALSLRKRPVLNILEIRLSLFLFFSHFKKYFDYSVKFHTSKPPFTLTKNCPTLLLQNFVSFW